MGAPRLVLAVLVLLATLAPGVAAAGPPESPPPTVTRLEWIDPPVTLPPRNCEVHCPAELLLVEAVDPDSSIVEVQVMWSTGVVFAHTHCVQGTKLGQPAVLQVPVSFTRPGPEVVSVQVFSQARCDFRRPVQESAVFELETQVLGAGAGR